MDDLFELKEFNQLKSNHQISPFQTCNFDKAKTLLMLQTAIELLAHSWYQSPHWVAKPDHQSLKWEEELEQNCKKSRNEVKRLASEIYYSLTGERIADNE